MTELIAEVYYYESGQLAGRYLLTATTPYWVPITKGNHRDHGSTYRRLIVPLEGVITFPPGTPINLDRSAAIARGLSTLSDYAQELGLTVMPT